ncbi:MAG: azu, partial [Akkermansiaceae bacterium]|nr:azu [Akkermansiaceae bacterium]
MNKLILTLATVCLTSFAHAEDKKFEITGNDQMQYSVKALEVTAGDKVTVTLKHIGALPKVAMGHNFVLLKKGVTAASFATKAMKAPTTDYIPQDDDSKKEVVAHTKILGGGESDSVTFDAPTEAGDYIYLCTFPGHFALMNGVLTV